MLEAARAILEKELLQAHARGDADRLAELYLILARGEETHGRTEAACFFLTQAYVFALESGSRHERDIANRLRAYQREPAD